MKHIKNIDLFLIEQENPITLAKQAVEDAKEIFNNLQVKKTELSDKIENADSSKKKTALGDELKEIKLDLIAAKAKLEIAQVELIKTTQED